MATLIPSYELCQTIGMDRVEIDASTVGEFIKRGTERFGEPFWAATQTATIAVNGRAIALLKAKRTKLTRGDVIWLLKPSGGG
jgi:molybdopterin converting factor small subunit